MKKLIEKYRELIIYIIFGVLTTAVNYIIHFAVRAAGSDYYISLSVAWAGAVLFAYVTNKLFVFNSRAKGKEAFREFALFVGARVFSYGLELVISFIFIDLAHIGKFVWTPSFIQTVIPAGELIVKTLAQVFIVISNYIFSKLVIFKKNK